MKEKTQAQLYGTRGSCWGKKFVDIDIGDSFIHGTTAYMVQDVVVDPAKKKCRIVVPYAHKFLNGGAQTGEQWFNQDAEIKWLTN